MKFVTNRLKNKFYAKGTHPYSIYEDTINTYIRHSSIVLDAGCGREASVLCKFVGKCRMLIGLDISKFGKIKNDEQVYLCESDLTNIPVRDKSIDMVISRSVLEHVKNPVTVYEEINRVLKPAGYFIFLTPNFYDYASILATLIPNRFHSRIVKMTEGRDEEDTFPTYYRSNTERDIKKLAKTTGFQVTRIDYLGQYPSYFMFDGLVKSQNLELLPQLVGIIKVVNTPYIVATKISPDFLRDHHV